MKIVIDNREKKFYELCKAMIEMNEHPFELEFKKLDLGDIIICDKENNELLMIERKTPGDLASSILDGRYKEQSYRLSKYPLHNHNIYYLIEGSVNNYNYRFSKLNKNAIHSAIISIRHFKGFSVMQTSNMTDSVETILRVCDKLHREKKKSGYYSHGGGQTTNTDKSNNQNNTNIQQEKTDQLMEYASMIKKEKKLNITPDNIGVIMLSQIPGVSTLIAKTIMSNFSGFREFFEAFRKDSTILKNATYKTSNGSERRISNTSVQNIKKYLFTEKDNQ